MKITIPAREVVACDHCRRTEVLVKPCLVCKRDTCHHCKAILLGVVVPVDLCKTCGELQAVGKVLSEYGVKLHELAAERDAKLGRLLAEAPAVPPLIRDEGEWE